MDESDRKMTNEQARRNRFEEEVVPSFPSNSHGLRRKPNGEYVSGALEDHWQTYQEGWLHALEWFEQELDSRLIPAKEVK